MKERKARMKNKILLLIADGVGDRPCEELGYLTPLQYANANYLDQLAEQGSAGIMDLHQAGTPVGTDLGHLILFGYSLEDYPGRGPIEAFGNRMELIGGDIAFRCNFSTVDENFTVVDRRAGRIREGAAELAKALDGMEIDGVKVFFKAATEHRAVLVLRGEGLSEKVTDTDPKAEGKAIKKAKAKDDSPAAKRTADVLNKVICRAHEILSAHPVNLQRIQNGLFPANVIATRGAGKMPKLEKITERLGFKACCVASETTVLGVARLAGFDTVTDAEFTGNIDTNVEKKARFGVDALKTNDFVVVHYKATDLMGHDNLPKGKANAIEQFNHMAGKIMEFAAKEITDNVIIALAADHSTPCERREHSGDPVPIVISGKNIRKDAVKHYDEIACAGGGIGRIKGADFCNTLLDYLEVSIKLGN